jgi:cytochrome c-type biogenesis protein CcmF
MIAELGHLFAFLALGSAIAQAIVGLAMRDQGGAALTVRRLAVSTGALSLLAFVALIISFVRLDFSVKLVSEHSHSLKPILYRVAGAWGNHEGSMLLWCVITAGYGSIAALAMRPGALLEKSLGVQGLLTTASFCYLLFASSPFTRLSPAPLDGGGLNPLLQDPALALHPPALYLGYVGFSFVFSLAAGGLILGQIDRAWARAVQPWALASWSFLTIGIGLGSIWAYYELGWGGWWFWDPVENASFMPWLVGAALVHSLLVTSKRGGMASWTALLSVMAFCLSILGAFLVRSGVLTSVHAFAVDPERGMLLLIGLVAAGGGALALYAWRAPSLKAGPEFDPVSREGALVLNNLFLSVAAATVLLGTTLPLVMQAFNATISIQEPYFHLTLAPLMALLFLVLPVAQEMTWRRAELKPILKRLAPAAGTAAVAAAFAYVLGPGSIWHAIGVFVGVWVIGGVVIDLARRIGQGGLKRAGALSLGVWGMSLAHIGLGLFVIGAVTETAARVERTYVLAPGQSVELRGWSFTFNGVQEVEGPNFYASEGLILVTHDGRTGEMRPQKRIYPVAGTPTTEVALRKTLGGDVYVAMGDPVREQPGAWRIRISHHPMIDWIFGGAILIALGGFMALASRLRRRSEARVAGSEATPESAETAPAGVAT